jgi:hypothetical protein
MWIKLYPQRYQQFVKLKKINKKLIIQKINEMLIFL